MIVQTDLKMLWATTSKCNLHPNVSTTGTAYLLIQAILDGGTMGHIGLTCHDIMFQFFDIWKIAEAILA